MMEYGTVKNYFEIPSIEQGILRVGKFKTCNVTLPCNRVVFVCFLFCFEFPTLEVPCLKFKMVAISK